MRAFKILKFQCNKAAAASVVVDRTMSDQASGPSKQPPPANNGQRRPTSSNSTSPAHTDASSSAPSSGHTTTPPTHSAAPLNNTRKRTPDEYTRNFDLNEISPLQSPRSSASSAASGGSGGSGSDRTALHAKQHNCGASNGGTIVPTASTVLLPPIVLNMGRPSAAQQAADTTADMSTAADATAATMATTVVDGTAAFNATKRGRFSGQCDAVLSRLELGERARRPFVAVCALCALLAGVVIVMAVLWPRVPAWQRATVCVERECMEASAQVSVKYS